MAKSLLAGLPHVLVDDWHRVSPDWLRSIAAAAAAADGAPRQSGGRLLVDPLARLTKSFWLRLVGRLKEGGDRGDDEDARPPQVL